ncbi:MAG: signal peptidase II [Victivallaceae bacterium]|nr:signal peptidase II [Victivallaceae bacterium]
MGRILTLTKQPVRLTPGSRQERRVIFFAVMVTALLLVIDQITKAVIVHKLALGEKITIIPDFFYITHVTNRGAAWGILQGYSWLLLIVAAIASCLIIIKLRWLTEGLTERYFIIFVIFSGIIGNSVDRIWRREVIDFLDFIVWPAYRNGSWQLTSWPAFNISDSAICVGVGAYFISLLLRPELKKDNSTKPEVETTSENHTRNE